MLDIKLIREQFDPVKTNIKKRGQTEKVALAEKIKKDDEAWRKLKVQVDELRALRNKLSKQIADAKKTGKDTKKLLKEANELPEKMDKIEADAQKLRDKIDLELAELPNMLHSTVPMGKDGTENPVVKEWGKVPKFDFELKNHSDLIEEAGLADFEAGRRNSGAGFNYILSDVAMLDHALQRYGIDFLIRKGFTLVVPPMLLNKETFLGAANGVKDIAEVVYKVEGEDLFLIGTAEHSLVGLNKEKVLNVKDLPLKLCALTACFRKEIGGHGVDMKGLFRMHQFNKVEQVVFAHPDKSFELLEEMQKITEDFFQSLKLPYRVVEICSGDLSAKFAKQYDIEAWFPRQNTYREVTSAGTCTDYQARALNIKFADKGEKAFVHILNNTMVATSRAMVAILENYQQKDGTVKVPDALLPYMHGKKFIGKK